MRNLLITGGAGFIGSNFVHYLRQTHPGYRIVVYDKLTYAGRLENLARVKHDPLVDVVQGDIADSMALQDTLRQYAIDTVVNFAAETHVDRSIADPSAFVRTNLVGTYVLLEAVKELGVERALFVSTDEVYGPIPPGRSAAEDAPLRPRSPYAAAKAGADHLVSAYHVTYGLPTLLTRGTNTIGPYQYPEKAVPLFITNAIDDLPLPLYGDGRQARDYQYVLDHCTALDLVLHRGQAGEAYNLGTQVETENLALARMILDLLGKPPSLLRHVADRPGHDRRYAVDCAKLRGLGWQARYTLAEALEQTVRWYVEHQDWWRPIKAGEYRDYYRRQYGELAAR